MLHIAITYYSAAGHTCKLASIIKEGIESVEALSAQTINVETISDTDWDFIHAAHGHHLWNAHLHGIGCGPI